MNLTLSPQIKLVALVGLLAALGLGVVSMLMSHSQSGSSNPTVTAPAEHAVTSSSPAHPASTRHTAPAHASATHPRTAGRTHAAPKTTHPKTPAKHVTAPAPRTSVAPPPAATASGLPAPLDILLHGHRVVVVSLYDPEVAADGIALAEARAGARDAHAGFLAVDVLDGRVAGPLTALAGQGTVLPAPGILIYRQPGTLMNRIDGFSDRAAVAQAVASASVAPPPAATP